MVGKTISHYHILEKLGEGGMGVVYKAEDTKLERTVALKFLSSHLLENDEARERFVHEAKAAATLDHPNIATVFEIDEADGQTFLVMACIEGPTLKEKIDERPLKLKQALDYAIEIAQGLEAAHNRGIIHRDIKPANVMLGSDGHVKIMDFGLAHLGGRTKITKTGVVLGTPSYMAPEQLRGVPTDRRADIWSFGVVLHEMITGRPPFEGETEETLSYGILHNEPEPLTALRSGVPVELDRVVSKLLAKDVDERYQHIDEALVDLRALRKRLPETTGTRTATVPAAAKRSWLWPAVAGLCLTLAAAFCVLWLRGSPPPGASVVGVPSISPDGRSLAYVASTPATGQTIYLRSLDALGARIVPGTEGALYAFWSPDGKSLGFTTRAGFKRVDLARGAPRILSTLTHGSMNGTWNQQGDVLFYPSQDPPPVVQRISASGGPVTRVTRLDEARGETSHRFPKFLPDGRRFLFFAYNRDPSRNSVELATLGSFERKTVLEGVSASVFAQAPGGKAYLLYTRDGILFAHRFDESEGAVLGEPVVLASDVGGSGTDNLMPNVSVSDSGTLVYCSGSVSSPGRLAWFDRQGRMLSELPPEAAGLNATLSPDGRMLAVHRFDETRRVADIWVTDLARSVTTRLTFSQGGGQYPVWSPDGKQIIYRTTKNGQPELNQKDASGSGEERLVVVGNLFPMGWFRDGTHLVVRGATVRASDLSVLPLERDRKPIPLATAYTTAASVSPDGKLIAYDSLESGEREVFVISMPPAIGKWQVSSGGGSQPAWRGDGKELYFLAADSSMMAVDVQFSPAFSHGAPRRLFPSGVPVGSTGSQYAPTADGQRFLIRLPGEDSGTPITVVHNWWAELKQ